MGKRVSSVPNEQTEEGCPMNKFYAYDDDADDCDDSDPAFRRRVWCGIALVYLAALVALIVRVCA